MKNDFYVGYYEDHYIAHHGILGQKWGKRSGPPYPLKPEDHSSSEKKAGWRASLKEKHAAKKRKKQQQAALEKARQARVEKAKQAQLQKEYDEKKQEVLRSGKASEILKYKGQMTNQEMNDAINRINNEKRLYGLASEEQKTTWQKIDGVMNKVGDMSNWINKAVNGYEAVNKALKIVNGEKDSDEVAKERKKAVEAVVKSGNLETINKYKSQMTNVELRSALDKVKVEDELAKLLKESKEEKK